MSLSSIVQAVTAAAGDFGRHTSSTPPRSYFGGPINIPGADEDPWEGVPAHEMERVRLRLAMDQARRNERAAQRVQVGAETRRVVRLAGAGA